MDTFILIISILLAIWIVFLIRDLERYKGALVFGLASVAVVFMQYFWSSQVSYGTWIMDFMNMYENVDTALIIVACTTFIINFVASFILLFLIKSVKNPLIYFLLFAVGMIFITTWIEPFIMPIIEKIL